MLREWASNGSLAAAAQEALLLESEHEALQQLVEQLAAGDFRALPEIELLSDADINGAMGAYALSTGKIYLNADWVVGASPQEVYAVLTEELGHHLDGLLNAVDTPGDEGRQFAMALGLNRSGVPSDNDAGVVLDGNAAISVEQASVPIPAASPGRTSGEYRNYYAFAALKADGSVVTWGSSGSGGDSSSVASQLRSGVSQIFSSYGAFAALKTDGSVVT